MLHNALKLIELPVYINVNIKELQNRSKDVGKSLGSVKIISNCRA